MPLPADHSLPILSKPRKLSGPLQGLWVSTNRMAIKLGPTTATRRRVPPGIEGRRMSTSPGQILFFKLFALDDFLQHFGVGHFCRCWKKDEVQIDLRDVCPGWMDGGGPESRGGGLRSCGGSRAFVVQVKSSGALVVTLTGGRITDTSKP